MRSVRRYNSGMNRIIVSRSGDGWFNLALDEYLLEQHRSGKLDGVTLYFYVNEKAVIIGRNQNAWRECDLERMNASGVQLVRRHTGGGAVYHDEGNLNFSFIADEHLYDKERQNSVILSALNELGIKADISGRNDFTVNGRKISGCAYGLSGTARGMHGTLLINTDFNGLSGCLKPSKFKLSAKGITSVRARVCNLSELMPITVDSAREAVIRAFKKEYGDCEKIETVRTCDDVLRRFSEIARTYDDEGIVGLYKKQSSWEWRLGAAPRFDARFEGRLSFGEFQLDLLIKNGIVRTSEFYTDALETSFSREITKLLDGKRFDRNELAEALDAGGAEARELAEFIRKEGIPAFMNDAQKKLVTDARRKLHLLAEPSCREKKTKAFLMEFLRENTSFELHDMGAWFYAKHDEGAEITIAVRADFDAVNVENEARHLCGHDGHSAALLGHALLLEGRIVGKNVILLFQHAEETGEGAEQCLELFKRESVDAIIGAHNIPGEPLGTVLLKHGTFACASCGMEIRMQGRPTHAAYPENGKNPAEAISTLALELSEKAKEVSEKHSCMTLSTIVGMLIGDRAFGVAASDGCLLVTLRSEKTEALNELVELVRDEAAHLANNHGLRLSTEQYDVFPATVNDGALVDDIMKICSKELIPYKIIVEPFRWSEDFGHYAKAARSAFLGIGSGEDTAPLHTEGYEYPDGLLDRTAEVFFTVLNNISL